MNIGPIHSKPGELVRAALSVGTSIEIPVWIAEGHEPGKTMFLSAAIHGNEINAVAVLQRFVKQLDLTALRGCVLMLPIANLSGYRAQTRHVPEDGKDLNRCFPGNPNGTPSEQIADAIFSELLPKADVGVDIHDSGPGSVLLPHPRILRGEAEDYLDLTAIFGSEIIMTSELPPGYEGVMPVEARRQYGLPIFTIEVGGGIILWESLIEQGVLGLNNLLVYNDMLPGKITLPRRQFFLPGRDDLVRPAPIGGLLTRHVELGEAVVQGQPLVTIEDPLTLEQVSMTAPECGIVVDLNMHGRVELGGDVVGVIEFGACEEERAVPILERIETRLNEPSKHVVIRENDLLRRTIRLLVS